MKCLNGRMAIALLCLVMCLVFCACGEQGGSVPGEDPVTEPPVRQISLVVTPDTIVQLEDYPELMEADLSGSTCYAEIMDYILRHPEVTVTYTVDLGGYAAEHTADALILNPDSVDYALLLENLQYLPAVTTVELPNVAFSAAELTALMEAYPNITFTYTVEILGQYYDAETQSLDLSAATPDDVPAVGRKLALLPALNQINLMNEDGVSQLSMTDVAAVMLSAPNADVVYTFELFGQTLSTDTDRVEFVREEIGNEGVELIRQALNIMPNCSYFLLDNCGIDNEVMAQLRDDYPNTKIVWRVWYGNQNDLTDEIVIRHVYNLDDTNCSNLMYFTDTMYMDLGHNTELSDFSFVAYMPNLEIVIASGSPIVDLTSFSNCPNLLFLELAYCYKLEDLSPLGELENLRYLNISFTAVSDLTPIENLDLELLSCLGGTVNEAERKAYLALHPDCLLTFAGRQPYGYGWRYVDHGYTYNDIYRRIRDIFGYDNMDVS